MTEAVDLDKSGPVKLLESRRRALVGWLAEGEKDNAAAEAKIKKTKELALEMLSEIDEIEAALNKLQAIDKADLKRADEAA